jgi:hypothetical protein
MGNSLNWPLPQTAQASSVPASGGVGTELENTMKDLAIDQKTLAAAITPIAGAHVGQIPSAMTRPIGPAPQTEGYAQPRSKGQAISNMITSAGNTVSKIITAEKQKKQAHLVDQTTRLFTAQQASDEAQQAKDSANAMLVNATGDEAKVYQATIAQADETITKNAEVIKGIAPKDMKAISKGMNFNYIDPSENKTEEHAAVRAAIENVKGFAAKREAANKAKADFQAKNQPVAAQNFAQAFAKAQPQGMATNTMAQQKVAAAQATQKLQYELTSKLATIQGANNRAAFVQASQNLRQMQNQSFMAQKIDQTFAQNKYLTELKHTYRLGEISAHIAASSQAALELFRKEHLDPTVLEEFQTKTTQSFIKDEGTLATVLQKAQSDYSAANAVFADPKTTKAQRDQATQVLNEAKSSIYSTQAQQKNLQRYKDNFYKMVSNLKNVGTGGVNAGASYSTDSNAGAGGGAGESANVSAGTGITSEEDREWDQDINFFLNAGLPEFQQK